jgi:DNA-binding transcriptional ArsR family regulator
MDAEHATDDAAARIAAAIGEPARSRMLYCLMDHRARTSTELAAVAGVGAPTASAHLNRLRDEGLVRVQAQGKHRYYSLAGPGVAGVLEGLCVLAGATIPRFVPRTPPRLRGARTCYDHIAGSLGVQLNDRFRELGWLSWGADGAYALSPEGARALGELGIDLAAARRLRRRFAFGCLDWSERRAHLGGALGAAVLGHMLRRKWVVQDLDGRALSVTELGRRQLRARLGIEAGEPVEP